MGSNRKKFSLRKSLLFFFPFVLWLAGYRSFYEGTLRLAADAQTFFSYTNYYLNSILRGVYPLWDPFNSWGRVAGPFARFIGEYNPFIYFVAVLNSLGVPFYLSYFAYLASYFFLGTIGFYLLARRLFGDERVAYLAFILMLFSTMGNNIFNDTVVILIFTSIVWFFYFLVAFTQTGHRNFFLGLTFTAMMMAVTYLPFYFLTFFLIFIPCFILIFYRSLGSIFRRYIHFFKEHKWLVLFCAVAFAMSLLPAFIWYKAGKTGEFIMAWRHFNFQDTHVAGLTIEMINVSSSIGFFSFKELFSGLASSYLLTCYVPTFAFLIFLLGLVFPFNKKLVLFCVTWIFILLVSLTDSSWVHEFLYNHVFFFQLFRNLHFFGWLFLLPVFILFVAGQFRMLLSYEPRTKKKTRLFLLYITVVHLGFAVFLFYQDFVLVSSYGIIILSFIFFVLHALGVFKERSLAVLFALMVIVSLQGVEVFHYIGKNTAAIEFPYSNNPFSREEAYPKFSFTRPKKGTWDKNKAFYQGYWWGMEDSPGFVDDDRYMGAKWSYFLHEKMAHDVLTEYVHNKFIVYDQVETIGEDFDIKKVERAFAQQENIAFVPKDEAQSLLGGTTSKINPNSQIIAGNSEQFQVLEFDLNSIKFQTNFDTDKFLVYNDSFHSGWRVFVNGNPEGIVRANIAFKGLWLPEGKNVVCLRFESQARRIFDVFLAVFFIMFLFLLIFVFSRMKTDRS